MRRIVVVEVKCFADRRAYQDDLYRSIGQYVIYRRVLTAKQVIADLYLAIPDFAYEELFRKPLIAAAIQEIRLKLITVNVEREEITAWLD